MSDINEVLSKINDLKKEGQTFLIAIDGFGGSGKSTLAQKLTQEIPGSTIIPLDDFYSSELGQADIQRLLREVLKPLKEGREAQYLRFDWNSKSLKDLINVTSCNVVIIEGVYSLHPDLRSYYDLSIWVNLSQDQAAQRGIDRDLNIYKVDHQNLWKNIWMPKEKEYVNSTKPQEAADLII
jgi:uridine kinase